MRGLDETDREILRILLDDARRPYSEIADVVDLSPPAVSDRIERLQEIGLIRRFTVDVDRSLLYEGVPVLVEVDPEIEAAETIRQDLADVEAIEHLFSTGDGALVFTAAVPDCDVRTFLAETTDVSTIREYDVRLLAGSDWQPSLGNAELAIECVECGNTVTSEGETARIDGTLYHFCCPHCESAFRERYEQLKEGVES